MKQNNYNNKENRNDEFIDLTEFVNALQKHWKWIPISLVLCCAIAFAYIKIVTPTYHISSKVFINDEKSGGSLNSTMAALTGLELMGGDAKVEDKVEIIKSHTLFEEMVKELQLHTSYFDISGFKSLELYKNNPIEISYHSLLNDTIYIPLEIFITKEAGGDIEILFIRDKEEIQKTNIKKFPTIISTSFGDITFNQKDTLPKHFEYLIKIQNTAFRADYHYSRCNISPINKYSNVINLNLTDNIKERGKDVITKLIELYNLDAINDKNITSQNTADFIEERLNIISEELGDVEKDVEKYKRENDITDIESQAKLLITSSSELEKELIQIETQLSLVSYIEEILKKADSFSLLPANLGVEDVALVEEMSKYNELVLERLKLSRSSNAQNPVKIQIEEHLKLGKDNILSSISNIKSGYEIAKRALKRKESQNISKIKNVPKQEKEFIEIKRQQQIKETLYLFLLQKREETALSLAITAPVAKTIDKARASMRPIYPNKKLSLLIALFLGLLIPIVVIFIFSYFDNKIKNRNELNRLLKGVPIIGEVSLEKEKGNIVVLPGSHTPISEMFRIIRTNLAFFLNNDKKVILVTSSISGEGKSFNAINLAMSFALTNKKTIIVGLDIRNPQLYKYLHLHKKNGITTYLADESITTQDIIQPTKTHENLFAISSGIIPPNPSELLLNKRLDELFVELRKEFDYIIIDTAPVGIVTDTFIIDRVSDATVYVCKQDYTEKNIIKLINEIHEDKKLKNISVLLNGTDGKSTYGYGYGYGMSNGKKKKRK